MIEFKDGANMNTAFLDVQKAVEMFKENFQLMQKTCY